MPRPRMSPSDELRYCKNALADALAERDALAANVDYYRAERDALAATVERVRRLIDTYSWTVDTADLRRALASPGDHTPEAGQ